MPKKSSEIVHDEKLPPASNFCRCAECGEYFTSETPYDMHRVGAGHARRCLTQEEMRVRGMSRNQRGYWRSRARAA